MQVGSFDACPSSFLIMQRSTVARLARPSTVRRYASPAVGSAVPGPSASPSKDRSTNQRPRKAPTGVPNEVGLAAAALLPAVPLYRRILRAHNHLPIEMKSLGDSYVKDEFRRHTDIDNPLHIIGFLTQWKLYLDALETEKGVPTSFRGKRLDMEQFEKVGRSCVWPAAKEEAAAS